MHLKSVVLVSTVYVAALRSCSPLTAVQRGAFAPVFGPTICVIKRSCQLSPTCIARDLQEAGKKPQCTYLRDNDLTRHNTVGRSPPVVATGSIDLSTLIVGKDKNEEGNLSCTDLLPLTIG